jgi:hypothetical protein
MAELTIQIDSREKARAIKKIISDFEQQGVKYYISKLWTGDYLSLDNPRVIIDRKQNLTEVCSNMCQQHERFRNELVRAHEMGIKLIILIEHSNQIKSIEDVAKWQNPRLKNGNKAMSGETLSKIMTTMERKYGCKFMFCDKLHTGKRIIEILGGE